MAQRRMCSLKVIDTDLFLDMPVGAQSLYFHLIMRADDDGFVSSPRKIMKITNASDDDFRLLISKQFVIPFETGICVIRHWRIHNYIKGDRYNPTLYQSEKGALDVVENRYEWPTDNEKAKETPCIQNGVQDGTTGKVRLGKDRLGYTSQPEGSVVQDVEPYKPKKKTPDMVHELDKQLDEAFRSVHEYANFAKERAQIKRLREICERRNSSEPGAYASRFLETYHKLTQNGDAFWRKQPFTPSAAVSLFDRIEREMQQEGAKDDVSWVDEV